MLSAKARLNFTVVQSRLKLVMWVSWPNGTMWSWPFWWRSRIERTEKPSTVPLTLLPSMYSPTRNESSARKNMPETMSRTSDWLPNDTARPSTEAPAISGVMLTPSSDSTSRPPSTRMTTPAMTRSTGMRVRSREAAAGASSSASAIEAGRGQRVVGDVAIHAVLQEPPQRVGRQGRDRRQLDRARRCGTHSSGLITPSAPTSRASARDDEHDQPDAPAAGSSPPRRPRSAPPIGRWRVRRWISVSNSSSRISIDSTLPRPRIAAGRAR